MLEAIAELVTIAWGAASPRASSHDEVIVISRQRADEDVSSMLGMVAARTDQPLGRLWVNLCRPDILGGLASP